MTTPNTDVNAATPPTASGSSSTSPNTPASAPAQVAGGGNKLPETVPYNRFQEVTVRNTNLAEENENLRRQLSIKNQPTNPNPQVHSAPLDPNVDPVGFLVNKVSDIEAKLDAQEGRAKFSDGERFLGKIKADYPIFNDSEIGSDALDVLHSKLNNPDVQAGIVPLGRVVREVAERYSKFKVASNNSLPEVKGQIANATHSLPGGTPQVGDVKPPQFKPKTFDEAHKAAGSRWDALTSKMQQGLQV